MVLIFKELTLTIKRDDILRRKERVRCHILKYQNVDRQKSNTKLLQTDSFDTSLWHYWKKKIHTMSYYVAILNYLLLDSESKHESTEKRKHYKKLTTMHA